MVNAQTWLLSQEEYNTEEKRNKITKLDVGGKKLEGNLNLSEFVNLEELNCSDNKLTNLEFNDKKKITKLDIRDNLFSQRDLSFLSEFTNLETLKLGRKRINWTYATITAWTHKDRHLNSFGGSLEGLQNISQLKELSIINTDISEGLEYLPVSLEKVRCGVTLGRNLAYKCSKICKKLKDYELENNEYDLAKWRKDFFVVQKWKDIHLGFTLDLQKKWEENGFTFEECKEWVIRLKLKPEDANFAQWLRDVKKRDVGWILICGDKGELCKEYIKINNSNFFLNDFKISTEVINQIQMEKITYDDWGKPVLTSKQELFIDGLILDEESKERYKKFGLCEECQQPNATYYWCQSCDHQRLKQNFKNWTSGSREVDKFIQKCQLEAVNSYQVLEWIPHEQLADIEFLAEGGFGKVYKAKWQKNNQEVALKILNDSQGITADFLQEATNSKLVSNGSYINLCYGISQDPKNKNYIMVMQYVDGGNLRQYLSNNQLSFEDKIEKLYSILNGLINIHNKGLVHRDLHAGNILGMCWVADLGLCRPVGKENNGEKFGVLTYVAPEVLLGEEYTQKSDIYSFGMLAYEILTGLPPHYNVAHNKSLRTQICNGLRPKFNIKIPKLLEDLIGRCWDTDPSKRPKGSKEYWSLRYWEEEIRDKKDTEFYRQYIEVKEFNEKLPYDVNSYKIHPQASYISCSLDLKLPMVELSKSQNLQEENLTNQKVEIQIDPK